VDETHDTTERIEHELRVDASPEAVFEYFTDPSKLVRWMGSEATLDPRPGGVCHFEINGSNMIGKYVHVAFPARIVFTWGWRPELFGVSGESTTVEVSFVRDGDVTVVRLTHARLPHAGAAFHRAGWRNYLGRLAKAAAGADPGPDPWRNPMHVLRAIESAEEG
jgi:uncharacterized protein YndB with AHSA1/START domain